MISRRGTSTYLHTSFTPNPMMSSTLQSSIMSSMTLSTSRSSTIGREQASRRPKSSPSSSTP